MINLKIYPFISYRKQDKKCTFAQKKMSMILRLMDLQKKS
jgi:hypothetical protein